MKAYSEMTQEELKAEQEQLLIQYKEDKAKGLNLNMARGKPNPKQLDLSSEILENVSETKGYKTKDGVDTRNYGMLEGIPECRELFAELMEVNPDNVILGGTASLQLMFDYITQCLVPSKVSKGWLSSGKRIKFLCPCPGYDRHFGILEFYGIEMINIDMLDDGPDMDAVREAVKDEQVKGMFCVPKYSNPTGITYSDEKVKAIAALKPAADDFRIIWDNAYLVHDLVPEEEADKLLNIFPELKKNSNEDMVVEFCSTSKITFSGGGVSALAASDNNIAAIRARMNMQIISNDKINQLRHTKFLKNVSALKQHMAKHREMLAPKFKAVEDAFEKGFGAAEIASWSKPKGGYFISLEVMNGTAARTVELCRGAGITLTDAGAPFPYKKDPNDSNIRVAPSFPPIEELAVCADILVVSARLAATEKLIGNTAGV